MPEFHQYGTAISRFDFSMGKGCTVRCTPETVFRYRTGSAVNRTESLGKYHHTFLVIMLATDEFRVAFLRATSALPLDIQRIIWEAVQTDADPEQPPVPKKLCSDSEKSSRRWSDSQSPKRKLF